MKSSENTIDTDTGQSAWNAFWFGDSATGQSLSSCRLALVRIGIAMLTFWYFASHWTDIAFWFGGDGLLSAKALGVFLADAELGDSVRWRLSPLYWIDSPALLRGFLVLGMLLAIAMPMVGQTRTVSIALWLAVVWLGNRSMMIGGLEEVTLAWGLGYLMIARAGWPRAEQPINAGGWTASLAQRLLQIHLSIVFLVTGLAMLSSLAWWDGTGVMAVVSPLENRYFDFTETLQPPLLHELLTHGIVLGAISLPPLLWFQPTRAVGFCLAIVWCVTLAILSSQAMNFLTLAVLSLSFLPEKWAGRVFLRTDH